MRYTTIGSDPLSARKVSLLSLGAMRFGTTTDAATSFAILDRYVAAGGNFIDTSNNYLFSVNKTQGGESEALLGRWRASRGIGAEIVIATKVGARPTAPAADFGTPREGLSRLAGGRARRRPAAPLDPVRLNSAARRISEQGGEPGGYMLSAVVPVAAGSAGRAQSSPVCVNMSAVVFPARRRGPPGSGRDHRVRVIAFTSRSAQPSFPEAGSPPPAGGR
jgi:hypothetical protein